jgi:hypothetical protein
VETHKSKDWKVVASHFENRSPIQCLHRWTKILKPGLIKGPWTIEEDRKLLKWVESQGPYKWTQCSEVIIGRSGKQCRERWFNSLNPIVKKGSWSVEEDFIIFKRFSENGSKWSKIAAELPGRTENSIKNRFYSTLRSFATEQNNKKKSTNVNSLKNNSQSSAMSLSKLLTFFPFALEEKIKNFESIKEISSYHKEHSKTKTKFLAIKTKRPSNSTVPQIVNNTTNVNNTYNINLCFNNTNKDSSNSKQIKDMPLSEISNALNTGCVEDFLYNDSELNKLNNIINKEINENIKENITKNTHNPTEKPEESLKISHPHTETDSISHLITHLDDLEKILHMARQGLNNRAMSMNIMLKDNKNQNNPENQTSSNYLNFIDTESDNMSSNLFISDPNYFYSTIESRNFVNHICFNSEDLYNFDLCLDDPARNMIDGFLK